MCDFDKTKELKEQARESLQSIINCMLKLACLLWIKKHNKLFLFCFFVGFCFFFLIAHWDQMTFCTWLLNWGGKLLVSLPTLLEIRFNLGWKCLNSSHLKPLAISCKTDNRYTLGSACVLNYYWSCLILLITPALYPLKHLHSHLNDYFVIAVILCVICELVASLGQLTRVMGLNLNGF